MALFDDPNQQQQGVFSFGMDETAKAYMLETARWAKFLAIISFVGLALLGVAGIAGLALFSAYSSSLRGATGMQGIMLFVYAIIAALYFFPAYYLFRFAKLIKPAIINSDQHGLSHALRYLRNTFRFIGILMLIVLGLYALIFLVAMGGMALGGFGR